MPIIDVTEVLFDSDVAGQSFTVIRRWETVNEFGESTEFRQDCPAVGSVQPKGDQSLMREGSFDAMAKSIIIATTFRLRGATRGANGVNFKPDIVFIPDWPFPNYFEINSNPDWSAFGLGFIEAEATAINWIDNPQSALPPSKNVGVLDFSKPTYAIYAHGAMGF